MVGLQYSGKPPGSHGLGREGEEGGFWETAESWCLGFNGNSMFFLQMSGQVFPISLEHNPNVKIRDNNVAAENSQT